MGDSTYSAYELDELVMKAQEIDKRTIQQWRLGHKLAKRGTLWTKNDTLVVVGNNDLKRGVVSLFHDPSTAGHPRIAKTMTLAAQHYWWPGMKDFVTAYVKGCANCQMSKINMHPNKPAMFPITTVPNALPFQTIALDFIIKLPMLEGFDMILTITDHNCSKVSVFIPCNETVDVMLLRGARARRWQVGSVFAQASTSSFDGGWSPVLSEHSHKRLVLVQVNAVCVEV
jgi:Integrase zinc binding domain